MTEFLYPSEAAAEEGEGYEWVVSMLEAWHKSGRKYLCFPFLRYKPHTVRHNIDFWMYMYYRKQETNIEHLKGAVKFRIHIIRCSDVVVEQPDVYVRKTGDDEKIWFLCDKAEGIEKPDGSLLPLSDFKHVDGKKLPSTIRSSIAPVVCLRDELHIRSLYP